MKRVLSALIVVFSGSCIDPVNLKTGGQQGAIVIDGWITDLPGPYTVKISRSISYDNSVPLKVYSIPEKKAMVKIVDKTGRAEMLKETSDGVYQTVMLQGVVGNSYQVRVETANGKKYKSAFDSIVSVPPVNQIKTQFQVGETLIKNANGNSVVQKIESFAMAVFINDPAGTKNYYRWQVDGIFEFFSMTLDPFTKQCWAPVSRLESRLEIASDEHFDGQRYEHQLGLFIYDRPTHYLVKLRQQSLTASGYGYLKRISAQQTTTGTLFDPPPTPVIGNISNESDAEEIVHGYFGASSVVKSDFLVDRFKESKFVSPSKNVAIRPGDCRTQEPNATNIKPDGF